MNGPFCHICGQSLFAGRESFTKNLFNNALSLYAADFKIFSTVKLLLFYPGKLSKEYCRGHIIRYEHPFKLFWFVAVFFFIYFSYKFAPDTTKITGDIELNQMLLKYLPYATLVLIPLFSFLLFVFFRKYEQKYSNHTIFALHFHTFLYVFLGIALFVYSFSASMPVYLVFLIPFAYLMIAVYVFYKPKVVPAFLKLLLICMIHIIVMIILLLLFLILVGLIIHHK